MTNLPQGLTLAWESSSGIVAYSYYNWSATTGEDEVDIRITTSGEVVIYLPGSNQVSLPLEVLEFITAEARKRKEG